MSAVTAIKDDVGKILSDQLGGSFDEVNLFQGTRSHTMYTALWIQPDQPDNLLPVMVRLYYGPRREEEARLETDALRDLYIQGYPVPELLLSVADESVLGAPFIVMERLSGEPLGNIARADPTRIPFWVDKASTLLLKLHRLDWQHAFDEFQYGLDPFDYADRQIKWWSCKAGQVQAEMAKPGFEWLRAHIHTTRRAKDVSLIHRDFHPNNILAHDDRITGVVDWGELAIGDPAIDVGWSRMVLATEVSPQLGDNFIKTYGRHNPECLQTLAFWEVFAACKRLTVMAGLRNPNVPLKPGLENEVHDFMCQRLTTDEE